MTSTPELFNQANKERVPWNNYYIEMCEVVATQSTCTRRKVGAVMVSKDSYRLLATGFNGAPTDVGHCNDIVGGCTRKANKIPSGEHHEWCRGVHAEQNAIIQASVFGVPLKDAILYCTINPCVQCIKMLINVGVTKIYYKDNDYKDVLAEELIKESKIELTKITL